MSNFIDPNVLKSTNDITSIKYQDQCNQVTDAELGVGTSTRMLLCGELEDEVVGTSIESKFFKSVSSFYVASVSKILTKFPFSDNTIKELAFPDPRNSELSSSTGVVQLATKFTSFTVDQMDTLSMQFRDFRAASDDQLPPFDPHETAAIDHFWAAMAEVPLVTDLDTLRFGVLSTLAKVLLVLPHSKADPERLFSMIRKIDTEQIKLLDPSTVCDLLSDKVNNDRFIHVITSHS